MKTLTLNLYPENTSGNGVLWDSLHEFTSWAFAVSGATASNVFSINVGNSSNSTDLIAAQVQNMDGSTAATSITAPGIYRLTVPMPFRSMYVTRSGIGVALCSIDAIGEKT